MGLARFAVAMVTLVATLPLAACTVDPAHAPAFRPAVIEHARYPVGLRELRLARGDRPLRTVLLYPAAGAPGDPMWTGAVPAAGKFPLVLFSHGMSGSPERYIPAAASWTAAGFVVALPAYPHTGSGVVKFRRKDIVNQPRDAAFVIGKVRQLGRKRGDPLNGRIDGNHVAAVGHSAGGYTTTGLFHAGHAAWLRSGVVLAGWLAPGAFHGPPATMLFVQGDSDSVVPVARGRAAYDKVPWPKSFVLLDHNFHAQYMLPGRRGYPEMDSLVTDFLRWTLTGDEAARRRLPPSV
jgi:dienelactone hydrolase